MKNDLSRLETAQSSTRSQTQPYKSQLIRAADSVEQIDIVTRLLDSKRSPNTRIAYAGDLRNFFGANVTPADVAAFLALEVPQIALRLDEYKTRLRQRGEAEATINRRLAAIRALLKYAFRIGQCKTDGRGLVDTERVQAYRDTRGYDLDTIKRLCEAPQERYEAESVAALRDTALLLILCENALRRAEVCRLDVGDFSSLQKRLMVLGKGRNAKQPVTISKTIVQALQAYLSQAGHTEDYKGPLFRNLSHDPRVRGQRLTVKGLYHFVGEYGRFIGIENMTPHKLRHSAITIFLDNGGDILEARDLARHRDVNTTMIYNDNTRDRQGAASNVLSGLIGGRGPQKHKRKM